MSVSFLEEGPRPVPPVKGCYSVVEASGAFVQSLPGPHRKTGTPVASTTRLLSILHALGMHVCSRAVVAAQTPRVGLFRCCVEDGTPQSSDGRWGFGVFRISVLLSSE